MLTIKIFINSEQIDEIKILNIGPTYNKSSGLHKYKIKKPAGIDEIILHKPEDGYLPLSIEALKEIEKHG